ncbi:MAG: acetyl-CoA C-acetyltransferase [Gammaproteobacteria bacterium]|nr:acetyl-CoA C-acetyltransferase [Gammaproteobacteria bacterium]
MASKNVYIVDGSRSPQLKARGRQGPFSASDMAVQTARPLLLRNSAAAENIDEVILGCMMPGPDEANIARVVALRLGISQRVPAWTVQRNCASGMQSIDSAFHNIKSGLSDIVLAGGVEVMSHAPLLLNSHMVNWMGGMATARSPMMKIKQLSKLRPHFLKPVIALIRGLTDHVVGLNMGQTAEEIAYRFNISRAQMDEYAVASHQRLAQAYDNGALDEVEVLYDSNGNFYAEDDGLRRDSSVENLARLRPAFDRNYGNVTAGNSAQITDGASWLILASEKAVKKYNLSVLAKISDTQWAGLDPKVMGMGPVHAMTPIMQRNKLSIDDIDYWEINEAFATQVLGCVAAWNEDTYCKEHLKLKKAMGTIPHDRLNIDGGGISLGHPVGASGARIILHLAKLLERKKAKRGLASLCIGGGQGGAMLIEREEKLEQQ